MNAIFATINNCQNAGKIITVGSTSQLRLGIWQSTFNPNVYVLVTNDDYRIGISCTGQIVINPEWGGTYQKMPDDFQLNITLTVKPRE